jgi:PPIC-type PPIASE domain.
MKNIYKRIAATTLAVLTLFTLTGCYKQSDWWAAKRNDTTMAIGEYIYYLSTAYSDASYKVGTDTEVLKATIEDKKAKDYIDEGTKKSIQSYFYIEERAKDLEISEEDLASIENLSNAYWTTYGLSTQYEKLGISQDSFTKAFARQSVLRSTIFEEMYTTGDRAVSDDEFISYYEDNYYSYEYFTAALTTKDEEGNSTDLSDEAKKTLKDILEEYLVEIEDGKTSVEEAATSYKEYSASEDTTYDLTSGLIESASGDIPTAVLELKEDEVSIIETSSTYTLVRRVPIKDRSKVILADKDDKLSVLSSWKNEEFNTFVEEEAAKIDGIEYNNSAINTFSINTLAKDAKMGYSSVPSEVSDSSDSSDSSAGESSDISSASETSENSEASDS